MCPTDKNSRRAFDSKLDSLRDAFTVLDRDGDGIIASADLEHFLQKVVACKLVSQDDLNNMLSLVGGEVDFERFRRLLHVQPKSDVSMLGVERNNNETCKEMYFQVLDRNGDGFVCSNDMASVVNPLRRRLPEKDIQALLQTVGEGTSMVSYEEFSQYINY